MRALIIVDMLNDFVTGGLKCERAQRIIPNIKALAEAFRAGGDLVVFTNDAHLKEGDLEFTVWGPHAIAGTPGAQVIPELAPQADDAVVPKRRYSGFYGTDLHMRLQERGVTAVVLAGLHTHICVRHTCADAFLNGYEILVPADAVEAFTEKDQVEGVAYLKTVYGATITTTASVLAGRTTTAG